MKKFLVTYLDERDEESKIEVELSPNGKWLTREEVEKAMRGEYGYQNSFIDEALDELFGETP